MGLHAYRFLKLLLLPVAEYFFALRRITLEIDISRRIISQEKSNTTENRNSSPSPSTVEKINKGCLLQVPASHFEEGRFVFLPLRWWLRQNPNHDNHTDPNITLLFRQYQKLTIDKHTHKEKKVLSSVIN